MRRAPVTPASRVSSGVIVSMAFDLLAVRALSLIVVDGVCRIGVGVERRNQRHACYPLSAHFSEAPIYPRPDDPDGATNLKYPSRIAEE